MKKYVVCLVSLLSAVVLFCFTASAETVITTAPSAFSYTFAKAYNGQDYTTEVTKSIRTSLTDKYSVVMFNPQYSMGSGYVRVSSQSPFCTVPASGKVEITWECMIATNYSTDKFNTDVYCALGGDGFTLLDILPVSTRKGDWAVYYTFSLIIDTANTWDIFDSGDNLNVLGLYCSTTNNCTSFEFGFSAVTVRYMDSSDVILDGINDLPQYQDDFTGNYDMGGDSLNNAEQNNLNAAVSGLNGATDFWNGMRDNITVYASSFSVISLLMTKLFTEVPALYALVHFSIGLGLFAILLGVVTAVFRRRGGGKSDSGG